MESVNFVIVLNSAISPEEGKQFLGHFKRHFGSQISSESFKLGNI